MGFREIPLVTDRTPILVDSCLWKYHYSFSVGERTINYQLSVIESVTFNGIISYAGK